MTLPTYLTQPSPLPVSVTKRVNTLTNSSELYENYTGSPDVLVAVFPQPETAGGRLRSLVGNYYAGLPFIVA